MKNLKYLEIFNEGQGAINFEWFPNLIEFNGYYSKKYSNLKSLKKLKYLSFLYSPTEPLDIFKDNNAYQATYYGGGTAVVFKFNELGEHSIFMGFEASVQQVEIDKFSIDTNEDYTLIKEIAFKGGFVAGYDFKAFKLIFRIEVMPIKNEKFETNIQDYSLGISVPIFKKMVPLPTVD